MLCHHPSPSRSACLGLGVPNFFLELWSHRRGNWGREVARRASTTGDKQMPELPEIRLASDFVNRVCLNRTFRGPVIKSAVHKCPSISIHPSWEKNGYKIKASSRGKEMSVCLEGIKGKQPAISLVFRFGMSGRWWFGAADDLPKHAHLNFASDDDNVLSFVDPRRFGTFQVGEFNLESRGPDPTLEPEAFRVNVLTNLENKVFNGPICEVLLDQKFFNGIGNYLRAEILHRLQIRPFDRARDVLEKLPMKSNAGKPDVLDLCGSVCSDVLALGGGYTEDDEAQYQRFTDWLQCYQKAVHNLVDHNKRTIWFDTEPGPLAPKGGGPRKRSLKISPKKEQAEDLKDEPGSKSRGSTRVKKEPSSEVEKSAANGSSANTTKGARGRSKRKLELATAGAEETTGKIKKDNAGQVKEAKKQRKVKEETISAARRVTRSMSTTETPNESTSEEGGSRKARARSSQAGKDKQARGAQSTRLMFS